jgi:hypothetical protein
MANPEHLAILKQGVEAWNRWRAANPSLVPDLVEADLMERPLNFINFDSVKLIGADLSHAELMFASLRGAKLSRARLAWASLTGTLLPGADLSNCTLRGAKLMNTDLRQADLTEADLGSSQLLRVEFTWARLTGTNFGKAMSSWGVFAGTDLASAIGLDSVVHIGPSAIGVDTLTLSQGRIPKVFLQGVGVPASFIELHYKLPSESYYTCFISHSSRDQGFAEKLCVDLRDKGVNCWFAPEDLRIGDALRQRIEEEIRRTDKLLLVLSEHSVNSPWVQDEVEAALEREQRESRTVLLPIRIDNAVMHTDKAWAASIRRIRHIGDFSNLTLISYQAGFQRLLRDLKAKQKESP